MAEYEKLKTTSNNVTKDLFSSTKTLDDLKSELKGISPKNIIQRGIYLIDNLKMEDFPHKKYSSYYKVSFDDLKTIAGGPLPKFAKPPVVFVSLIKLTTL